MSHNQYYRPDGVNGVGYLIIHGAIEMHSIAWPDRAAERMTPDELERKGVTVTAADPPAAVDIAKIVSDHQAEGTRGRSSDTEQNVGDTEQSDQSQQSEPDSQPVSEAQSIRDYLAINPEADNATVIEALQLQGIEVNASQVGRQRKKLKE